MKPTILIYKANEYSGHIMNIYQSHHSNSTEKEWWELVVGGGGGARWPPWPPWPPRPPLKRTILKSGLVLRSKTGPDLRTFPAALAGLAASAALETNHSQIWMGFPKPYFLIGGAYLLTEDDRYNYESMSIII